MGLVFPMCELSTFISETEMIPVLKITATAMATYPTSLAIVASF